MIFEKLPEDNNIDSEQTESTENIVEQTKKITDVDGFNEAIKSGNLEEAEIWLIENKDQYDARWLDHRSLTLFRGYRENKDWEGAKRMISLAQDENGRRGRRLKLAEESGESY